MPHDDELPVTTTAASASGPSESLRIAFCVYRGNPHCGGQGVYTRALVHELTELGHSVTVFSGPPYPDLVDDRQLVRVPSLDLYRPDDPFRVPRRAEFATPIDEISGTNVPALRRRSGANATRSRAIPITPASTTAAPKATARG